MKESNLGKPREPESERPLTGQQFNNLIKPPKLPDDTLSPEEIAAFEELPNPTSEGLNTIRNETPQEEQAGVRYIFEKAVSDMMPTRNIKKRISDN